MAWTLSGSGSVATAANKTASSGFTTGAVSASVGEVVILSIAYDNTTATLPTISSITVPGGESATWQRLGFVNSPTATNSQGVRTEVWGIKVTQAWTAFQPVITLSAVTSAKACCGSVWVGGTVTGRDTLPYTGGVSTAGVPTNTQANGVAGDLAIGTGVREFGNVATPDADTTNGSWATADSVSTNPAGSSTADVSVLQQYKVLTGTGSQTYNPTGSNQDAACVLVLLRPDPGAVSVGRATETDTARSVTMKTELPISRATETDTARSVTMKTALAVGRATEADAARAVTMKAEVAIGRASETDSARAVQMSTDQDVVIGRATETDIARSISVRTDIAIGRATETDAARALTMKTELPIGRATETDVARAVAVGASIAIGRVVETDTARTLTMHVETPVPSVSGAISGDARGEVRRSRFVSSRSS